MRPLAWALLAASGATAQAQQAAGQADAAATLAPVTVSANPLGLDLNSTTQPASVLEGDALVEKRGGTLGDTLDGLPGVHSDTFGGGASRPVIRGQTAPRVKALSDGSELMDASAISPDHAVTTEPLLAERIEVLRGPAALLYGGGAIGGVVNVIDKKIPTEVPEKGIAAEAEIRGATGTKERAGAIGITAGEGNFAVRVEGMKRRSGDYRVPDWSSSKLDGSYSESTQGTVGMSWITPRGYIGLAFTHLESKYGLPGHNHEYEGCHPHGTHLHCGGHDHGDEDGHDHDHGAGGLLLRQAAQQSHGPARRIPGSLRRHREDPPARRLDRLPAPGDRGRRGRHHLQEPWLRPAPGQHKPVAGWRGVVGMQTSYSDFRADGEEAFLPRSKTRANGIFLLEEYKLADWRFELGARQDWQTVSPQGGARRAAACRAPRRRRQPSGTSRRSIRRHCRCRARSACRPRRSFTPGRAPGHQHL